MRWWHMCNRGRLPGYKPPLYPLCDCWKGQVARPLINAHTDGRKEVVVDCCVSGENKSRKFNQSVKFVFFHEIVKRSRWQQLLQLNKNQEYSPFRPSISSFPLLTLFKLSAQFFLSYCCSKQRLGANLFKKGVHRSVRCVKCPIGCAYFPRARTSVALKKGL